jgi:hypothetical protein
MHVVSPAPREAWAELVAADPHVLVTQTPAWTDCLCAVTGARDVSRLYDFGDGRRLLLPLVRLGGWPAPLAMEASLPPAWGFGGLAGPAARVEEVRAVLEDLRSGAALSARVRPNPLLAELWAAARPPGIVTLRRRAHVLDLRGGFDTVWRERFHGGLRRQVRRAERAALDVELDTTGRLVPVFYDLFMRSVERWARRQHEPPALARWRARRRDSVRKMTSLVRDLRGASRLWVAWSDGRPAAAILVLQGANAHYTRGAIDAEVAGPTRASHLLHRLAIEDACRAGCTAYHMGETGSSNSLAQFKEAFGAQPHEYAEYVAERIAITSVDRRLRTTAKRVIGFRDHV